ncbi:ATP-binding protein [Actinomadura sp. KC345]|uniref:ATP-binding protein n=1 Tax=Actinomadura sp. KC345 TaxID=2530371 RepID=UPI001405082D|nr:ATP-binding protein [Actinomadura sp. KC345]
MERTVAGPWALRRGFLATPDVVQQGRLIVESQALQWGLAEETVEAAVLIASELLTNAVRATPHKPVTLRMALAGDGIRVEVWDCSSQRPRASEPDLSMPERPLGDDVPDPGGWGRGIIDFLSEEHGVRVEFEGKSVWALLRAEFR